MLTLKYAAFGCDINFDAPQCLYLFMEDGLGVQVLMTKRQREKFFPDIPTCYVQADFEEMKDKFHVAA